ncbi:MAG: hypothetical protein GY861_01040 [bacterium]|nr:hypothetical protein [bacterium]
MPYGYEGQADALTQQQQTIRGIEGRKPEKFLSGRDAMGGKVNPAYTAWKNELDAAKSAKKSTQQAGKDKSKAKDEALKREGYQMKARPYEFDEGRYNNPYLEEQLKMLNDRLAAREGVAPPQVGEIDATNQAQSREYQMALMEQLAGQTRGEGGSLAQLQFQSALDKGIQSQHAMAASGAGVNPILAQKMAMQGTENLALGAGSQSAQLRLQEQMAAQQALGQVSGQTRGQDLGLNQLEVQRGATNVQAQLAAQQQLDQMTQFYVGQGMNQQNAQWAAMIDLEKSKAQQHQSAQTIGTAYKKSSFWKKFGMGLLGGAATIGGAFAGGIGAGVGAGLMGSAAGGAAGAGAASFSPGISQGMV